MTKSTPVFAVPFCSLRLASLVALSSALSLPFGAALEAQTNDADASNWPHLLGPAYDLSSPETGFSKDFATAPPRLLWQAPRGNSHTPAVVSGGRAVQMYERDAHEVVEALDAETGKPLWTVKYPVKVGRSFGIADSTRAAPSFSPDGRMIYTLGFAGDLNAIEAASGKVLWKTNLNETFGEAPFFFGRGASPLVLGDTLIVHVGSPGACVVAFDATGGERLWKAAHEWNGSYASPVPARLHGQERVLLLAAGKVDPPHGGLLSIDPATGKIDDAFPWRSTRFASVLAASPVPVGSDAVFITEDYGRGGALIRFDESLRMAPAWKAPRFACQFHTPLHHDGHLYGFTGSSDVGGELVCYEVASGKELWREGFNRGPNLGRGSLMRVDDAFLCLGSSGTLAWLELSPAGVEVLSASELFSAPETWASPALAGGRLYVTRNGPDPALLCYELR